MPAPKMEFPPTFFTKVADTAAGRGVGWLAIAEVLAVPDAGLVSRLRDGSLAQVWTQSAAWLGEDQHMLTAELMSLGVFSRSAGRRSADQDLVDLTADHELVVGDQSELIGLITELAGQCSAEASAWSSGDLVAGKELRASQREFTDANIAPPLTQLCVQIVAGAQRNIWRTLAKLVLAYLSADTGKDYQRAILDAGRKSGGIVDAKGFLRLLEAEPKNAAK